MGLGLVLALGLARLDYLVRLHGPGLLVRRRPAASRAPDLAVLGAPVGLERHAILVPAHRRLVIHLGRGLRLSPRPRGTVGGCLESRVQFLSTRVGIRNRHQILTAFSDRRLTI